jgi:hypothetical protein
VALGLKKASPASKKARMISVKKKTFEELSKTSLHGVCVFC